VLYGQRQSIKQTNEKWKRNDGKNKKKFSQNLFEGGNKKCNLKLFTFTNNFTVRPQKHFKIPVVLINEGKTTIPKCKLLILTRNNKDLKISPIALDEEIYPHEHYELLLECESNNQLKTYDFEIFVYSNNIKVQADPMSMMIEVNEDSEEEEMNEFLAMYSKILSLPKKRKRNNN